MSVSINILTLIVEQYNNMAKRLITYANGDKVVWSGRAEIHYHRTPIVKEDDLEGANHDEIEALKKNPHDNALIAKIHSRRVR